MPDKSLSFMMGKYEATFPEDRFYSTFHLWLQEVPGKSNPENPSRFRVGLTDYSVRLLQDVYFLEWNVDEGAAVRLKQEIGEIESSKALSSLYSPIDGSEIVFNPILLDDPSAINTSCYDDGWMYEMTLETTETLLSASQYVQVMEDSWEKTQQKIKGQLN